MIQEFVRHYTSKVASKKSIMERQLCVKLSPYCINNKRIDHHKEEFKSVPKVHVSINKKEEVYFPYPLEKSIAIFTQYF